MVWEMIDRSDIQRGKSGLHRAGSPSGFRKEGKCHRKEVAEPFLIREWYSVIVKMQFFAVIIRNNGNW